MYINCTSTKLQQQCILLEPITGTIRGNVKLRLGDSTNVYRDNKHYNTTRKCQMFVLLTEQITERAFITQYTYSPAGRRQLRDQEYERHVSSYWPVTAMGTTRRV